MTVQKIPFKNYGFTHKQRAEYYLKMAKNHASQKDVLRSPKSARIWSEYNKLEAMLRIEEVSQEDREYCENILDMIEKIHKGC